jgi:hypothetical protein
MQTITLESLLIGEQADENIVVDEMDIPEIAIEMSELQIDLNTCNCAFEAAIAMEGSSDTYKNIFRKILDRIIEFFNKLKDFIKSIIKKIREKFSRIKREKPNVNTKSNPDPNEEIIIDFTDFEYAIFNANFEKDYAGYLRQTSGALKEFSADLYAGYNLIQLSIIPEIKKLLERNPNISEWTTEWETMDGFKCEINHNLDDLNRNKYEFDQSLNELVDHNRQTLEYIDNGSDVKISMMRRDVDKKLDETFDMMLKSNRLTTDICAECDVLVKNSHEYAKNLRSSIDDLTFVDSSGLIADIHKYINYFLNFGNSVEKTLQTVFNLIMKTADALASIQQKLAAAL